MSALIVVLLAGGGVLTASAQSLPGDLLYPVKRAVEDLRLQFAPAGSPREALEDHLGEQRADEVGALLGVGRVERAEFEGAVTARSGDRWTVGGILVQVTAEARLVGPIEPGMIVEVRGTTQADGRVVAEEIRLRQYEFTGIVQEIRPDRWTVGGRQVRVLDITELDADIRLGDTVWVHAHADEDGVLAAREISLVTPSSAPAETDDPEDQGTPAPEAEEMEFTAVVEAITATTWTIGGRIVLIDAGTSIEGAPTQGATAEVRAVRMPGGLWVAERIRLHQGEPTAAGAASPTVEGQTTPFPTDQRASGEHVDIEGQVEVIGSGYWIVGGTTLAIDGATEVRGAPQVGDTVRVAAVTQANGQLLAKKIERVDG